MELQGELPRGHEEPTLAWLCRTALALSDPPGSLGPAWLSRTGLALADRAG